MSILATFEMCLRRKKGGRHCQSLLRIQQSKLEILRSRINNMRKLLVQQIRELKRQKQMKDKAARQNNHSKNHQNHQKQPDKINSPKRSAPSGQLKHREVEKRDKALFEGYTFCFPLTDRDISPKQIELLSACITMEGGKVVEFKMNRIDQEIDFLLINPKLDPQVIINKLDGKVQFKEMLDFNFITDCLKEGRLKNFQKYSIFVNVQEMWSQEKDTKNNKKIKRDSEDTVKLSDSEEKSENQRPGKALIKEAQIPVSRMIDKKQEEDYNKEEIQQIMLHRKNIGDNDFSMNKFIADELTKLMKIYATQRDIGRKIAYMKAAAVIRNLDKEIESERDVQNIKGIGKKISDKIKELLGTGRISKLQKLQGSQKNMILGQFVKIWGIGPAKALQIYQTGIKSIQELKTRTDLLTKNQKLGLKYHEQFQQKIPRQKVTKMFNFVKTVMAQLVPSLDMYNFEVCGSYRRGKATCGDMDIIISRKDGTYERHLLVDLVRELEKVGFLTDHLTTPKASDSRSSVSYMGVCRFQEPTHHRVDIKYYPNQQFAYAILYFTGSGTFNRMMRLHCMKLGLNLSDHGATPKMEKGVIWTKKIPTCYAQKDIFDFLEMEYKTPQQRDM